MFNCDYFSNNGTDHIEVHGSNPEENSGKTSLYGHEIKMLSLLKTYIKCRICKRRSKWPFAKTVKCQKCFLTCHETCLRFITCPMGEKTANQPLNIFESKVYTREKWTLEDCVPGTACI